MKLDHLQDVVVTELVDYWYVPIQMVVEVKKAWLLLNFFKDDSMY